MTRFSVSIATGKRRDADNRPCLCSYWIDDGEDGLSGLALALRPRPTALTLQRLDLERLGLAVSPPLEVVRSADAASPIQRMRPNHVRRTSMTSLIAEEALATGKARVSA